MKFASLILLVTLVPTVHAQCQNGQCSTVNSRVSIRQTPHKTTVAARERTVTAGQPLQAEDALDQVNKQRAARGLPPYLRDDGLTAGAINVANFRASRLMFHHTSNDFQGLPAGVSAAASGCAAYPKSYGFMACAVYERHRHAGAAWVLGRDGKMYCQIFVR